MTAQRIFDQQLGGTSLTNSHFTYHAFLPLLTLPSSSSDAGNVGLVAEERYGIGNLSVQSVAPVPVDTSPLRPQISQEVKVSVISNPEVVEDRQRGHTVEFAQS